MEKLVCQGAVSTSIRINDCIKNYAGGIIWDGDENATCGCSNVGGTNHAVAIVGYGVDHSNEICRKYWILKNSWGPEWGEGGFFRLCREDMHMPEGMCNIRSEPMIALKQ
jgi:C1A family cysteine protease